MFSRTYQPGMLCAGGQENKDACEGIVSKNKSKIKKATISAKTMHEKRSGWARILSSCKTSFSFDWEQFLLHIKMLQKRW
jgi:hypothetical protein